MPFEEIKIMSKHLARRLFGHMPLALKTNLEGKTAIITGASPGSIGFETAKTLAEWGAKVIITKRSNPESALHQLREVTQRDLSCSAFAMDLTNTASIQKFVQWYKDTHGDQLDVLINNAGIHLDLLSEWKSPKLINEQHEIHWRTNYLGTFELTESLIPLLRKAAKHNGDARVVNVCSHLHNKGLNADFISPVNGSYQQTMNKLATLQHSL
jgi:NAD(P)-dependent dehydrogenase (short-subunit alcohol dehydrogenase family)